MRTHYKTHILIPLIAIATMAQVGYPFSNANDAFSVLINTTSVTNLRWDAITYLGNHPEESVPRLLKMVENQETGWISANSALIKAKDKRIVPAYVQLLKNNFYEKEADRTRKKYGLGTKHGCLVAPFLYGQVLARSLGEMKDSQAIPVLKEAIKVGEPGVREKAYKALYTLGAMSLDELFQAANKKTDPEVDIWEIIQGIGWDNIHSNTDKAILIFDRIIKEAPSNNSHVLGSHFWNIQCYELKKNYKKAIQECDVVIKDGSNSSLVEQAKKKRLKLVETKP
jgi:tetratricopeptide (TPR) repeat protein